VWKEEARRLFPELLSEIKAAETPYDKDFDQLKKSFSSKKKEHLSKGSNRIQALKSEASYASGFQAGMRQSAGTAPIFTGAPLRSIVE
jgi:vacuolar-type H+-ATPase subunit H